MDGWTSAGGRPLADLGVALDGTELVRDITGRGGAQLVLLAEIAWPWLEGRPVIRIDRRERNDYVEMRCVGRQRATLGPEGLQCIATLRPRVYELSDSDVIREFLGGRWVYSFDVRATVREVLERFVFTNLVSDRLDGIVLGSVLETEPLQWAWKRQTRGELLEQVLDRGVCEPRWSYRPDGREQLDLVSDLGIEAEIVPLRYGDRLARLGINEDTQALPTLYRLAGDAVTPDSEAASFAENAWRVASVGAPSGGLVAVELREITGTRSPILQDGMWAGHPALRLDPCWLQRAEGLVRMPIEASSASASTVTVAAAQAPAVGEIVSLVADGIGTPLELIPLPASIARWGYAVGDQEVPGGRPERQYLVNAGHENGLTGWEAFGFVPATGVAVQRDEMGVSFSFRANGSRAGGTGTGTPMLVDGITPPGRRILAHDRITQEGWSSALTAAAIPDANGALSVPLASGLPAPMADNDAIRMRRLETAALAIVAGTPHSSGRLHLDVGNAALAQRLAAFARCDRYGGGAPGDLRLVGPSGERFDGNLVALDIHEDDAEVLVARYAAYGAGAEYPPIVALGTNVQVVSAHRLRIYTADHTMTGTLLFDFVRHGGGVNLPEWLWHPGGGSVLRFIGTIVGGGVFAGAPYLEADLIGAPAALDFVGLTGAVAGVPLFDGEGRWIGNEQRIYVYGDAWAGSCALTWLRETRTMRVSGAHSGGATTLNLKPIAALATHNWSGADTLHTPDRSFVVGGIGTWLADGTVSVPCTVPGGVTVRAGTRVWSGWHGVGPADAWMVVAATVVGPASAILVRGGDRYPSAWDGVSTAPTALYRVPSETVFELDGNVLEVASTVTSDGSGAASLVLTAPNGAPVPNDALLHITRPVVLGPTDRQTGGLLRLMCAVGGSGEIFGFTPGWRSPQCWFHVMPGATRTITLRSQFRLSMADWYAGEGPSCAIEDAALQILGWGALGDDGILIDTEAGTVTVIAQAVISASGWYRARLCGGPTSDASKWVLHDESMFYAGDAKDAPYTRDSYPSKMLLRCAPLFDERAQPRVQDSVDIEELSTMFAAAIGLTGMIPPLVLGGRVHIEELDRLERLTTIVERPGVPVARVEIGQVGRDGARLLGETVLAGNVGGVR
ncbi:hypothetical protein [Gemmatimonas aurantiaca]|nr:hypothetical protein [Gemmatimonas aurantiaca]